MVRLGKCPTKVAFECHISIIRGEEGQEGWENMPAQSGATRQQATKAAKTKQARYEAHAIIEIMKKITARPK